MVRLPRFSPAVLFACVLAVAMWFAPAPWASTVLLAQETEEETEEEEAEEPEEEMATDEEDVDAAEEDEAEEMDAEEGDGEEMEVEEGEEEMEADEADMEAEETETDGDDAETTDDTADAEGEEGTAAAEGVTAADAPLDQVVDAFVHYGTIARYDVAAIEGKKILDSGATPAELLDSVEKVMARRNKDRRRGMSIDQMLLTWATMDQTKEVSKQLMEVLNEGRRGRMGDPKFIDQAIQDLIVNQRSYSRALALLKQSGELAVPQMVDYLRDPRRPEFHARIQSALRDMGRVTLNPLVASLEMKDQDALVMVIGVLADLGYEASVPYIADLRARRDTPLAVREAADAALRNLGARQAAGNVADLYYAQAESFYAGTSSILSDKHYKEAFIWFMGPSGLTRKSVPHVIFDEVMAMRTAKRALELQTERDAQSLWLAANYRREAQLPAGATDPTAPADSAHFYGVDSGTRYLNAVLARALRDRDAAVALRAVKSLQEIIGRSNMAAGEVGQPLIDGMRSPDRLVRFESAFAVASALPQAEFPGRERVVPLLAEAVSQSGTPNVLVVAGEDEARTRVMGELSAFGVAGATGVDAAISEAVTLPSIDVIVVTKDVSDADAARLLQLASQSGRLDRAAKIVVRAERATPLERANVRRKDITFTEGEDAATLTKLIESTRTRAGGAPLEADVATEYALRGARLLNLIAKAKGATVLDTQPAEQVLLNALADPRPEVAKEVAATLAWVDSPLVQPALLSVATQDKTAPDVKVALFKALAGNAKNFGNQLQKAQFATVQNVVQKGDAPELRNAAAEAAGALNLPGDQARRLILDWSVEGPAQADPAQAAAP